MNCREFSSNAGPPSRPSPEQERHLAACASCAASFERQRALAAGLRGLADEYRRVSAPARVEARLLAEFRAKASIAPRGRAIHRLPVPAWAAAAALLLAAVLLFLPARRAPLPAGQAVSLAAADPESPDSDFIPLPYAGQSAADEDMDLVRVEVPRSAMIAAGFAVSADRAAEPVEADVLLGPDGLARAVRFVN